jgi:pimeloyl-ACP methyl ester carboxylesterase
VHTGRAHIVGLSLGGAIVLAMLNTVSEVVDHTIASSVFPHMNWLLSTANRRNEPLLHTLKPDQLQDLIFRQFKIPQQYRPLLSEDVGKVKPEVLIVANQMLTTFPLPKHVQSPLLIVVGQMDTIPAREAADSISASIAGARELLAPGVGHIWNLEAPTLFSNMVRSWVSDKPFPAALNVI